MMYLDKLFSLQDNVAVVTGATRGLGHAIAEALLQAGATVILVGSNEQRLDETAEAMKGEGLPAFSFRCDLAEPQQIEGLVDYVAEQHQRVDILVNNAGVTFSHDVLDYPDESWRKTFQINLRSTVSVVEAVRENDERARQRLDHQHHQYWCRTGISE